MSDKMRESLPARVEQRIEAHLSVAQRMKEKSGAAHAAPFVTVSRQYGCAAQQFAEALAAELARGEHLPPDHWPVYSRQIIEHINSEVPLAERLMESLDVHTRGGIEEFFETLVGRAPTIVAGCVLLATALRAFDVRRCEVSEQDILEGALIAVITGDW